MSAEGPAVPTLALAQVAELPAPLVETEHDAGGIVVAYLRPAARLGDVTAALTTEDTDLRLEAVGPGRHPGEIALLWVPPALEDLAPGYEQDAAGADLPEREPPAAGRGITLPASAM